MRTIMLHIHEDDGQEGRLQVALDLARSQEGHLSCLQVTPYSAYVVSDPFGGVYAFTGLIEGMRKSEAAHKAQIERHLESEGVPWDWQHYDGDIAQSILHRSRLADVIVLSRAVGAPSLHGPLPVVADVAMHARAPILVVPPGTQSFNTNGAIMIAWNGSDEAANALKASLPLLRSASSVHIVSIEEKPRDFPPTDASIFLSRHGIASEIREHRGASNDVTEILSGEASSLQAACIVMGAYGHSRAREFIIGGVTRRMMNEATVPLLLSH